MNDEAQRIAAKLVGGIVCPDCEEIIEPHKSYDLSFEFTNVFSCKKCDSYWRSSDKGENIEKIPF